MYFTILTITGEIAHITQLNYCPFSNFISRTLIVNEKQFMFSNYFQYVKKFKN